VGFDKDNYLVFLLSSERETEIHLLNEMAALIKYAQSSPQVFALKSSKGVIAHEELSEVLFEVYVNKFLEDKRLTLEPNSSYVDGKGETKPLDAFFRFEDTPYLVECYRPNEPSTKNLMRLSIMLLEHVVQKQLAPDQAFIGHITFKSVKDPIAVFKEATRQVLRLFAAYLDAFQSKETISIPAKYNSEQFSVEILPFNMGQSHERYFSGDEIYDTLTTFELRPKPDSLHRAELHVSGKRRVDPVAVNSRLLEKVKGKIKQHRDAPCNKIIFVEIDNTPGTNPNNPMFPLISNEHFDRKRFESLVAPDVILAFVFKTVNENDGVQREVQYVSASVHQPLIKFLIKK
jgi:2'-5' RNA ligase